jgi:BMFP domain-containing protein YqiC
MAKASNDLFSTLRTYLTMVAEGERTPAEVAAAVNSWARESADALKAKIHEEVEASVAKMGFIKRDEFDRLAAQVAALGGKSTSSTKSTSKKSDSTKSSAKKVSGKKIKKASVKKAAKK